jgi:transposase
VGLDVDDTQYHGSALDKHTGEVMDFQCRPTLKGLLGQLERLGKQFPGCMLRVCYEASYIGYTLQRDLAENGYRCDVVAPTSIPNPRGKQIKTDRIDAAQLAQFYANGLLTFVSVPEPQLEQDRDLLRSRQKLLEQQTELRKHLQSLLRRSGLHYKAETQNKTHWSLLQNSYGVSARSGGSWRNQRFFDGIGHFPVTTLVESYFFSTLDDSPPTPAG